MTTNRRTSRHRATRLCAARLVAAILLACLLSRGTLAQPAADRDLVVGVKITPPFVMKAEDGTWSGISIDLWRRLADDLHLHYRFEETSLEGLIDKTADGSLDAAIAALTVTKQREALVDFSQPFFSTGLGIAVPSVSVFDWWRLLATFLSVGFLEALLSLGGLTILVGIVIWLIERRHSDHFSGVRKGIASSVWWSALTMTQAGAEHAPGTLAGRLIAVTWMGASVIAIAVFTAGVTSQLTAKQLQGTVHGFSDLKLVRTGVVGGTASVAYLQDHGIKAVPFTTPLAGLTALRDGKIEAFVYDRPLLAWNVHESFGSAIEVLDSTFDKESYAIALPNGSPLRARINISLLALIHSQWWDDLNIRYLGAES